MAARKKTATEEENVENINEYASSEPEEIMTEEVTEPVSDPAADANELITSEPEKKETEDVPANDQEPSLASEKPKRTRAKKAPETEPKEDTRQKRLRRNETIETDFGRVILTDSDEETAEEIARMLAKRREDELDIVQSKLSGRILTDKVVSIEASRRGFKSAIVRHGAIKIIIPGDRFFPQENISVDVANGELPKRLGSKIDYVIEAYEKDDAGDIVVAAASRRDAMKKKATLWFLGNEREKGKIEKGDTVQARIVSANPNGCVVDIAGVETFVYARGADLKVGTNVLVDIRNLRIIEDQVVVQARMKNVDGISESEQAGNITLYSTYIATVTNFTNDGIFVTLNDSRLSCYCRFPEGRRPVVGDTVNVKITRQSDRYNNVFLGLITYIY